MRRIVGYLEASCRGEELYLAPAHRVRTTGELRAELAALERREGHRTSNRERPGRSW